MGAPLGAVKPGTEKPDAAVEKKCGWVGEMAARMRVCCTVCRRLLRRATGARGRVRRNKLPESVPPSINVYSPSLHKKVGGRMWA
eukprot:COSAG01_NODE_37329_length_505_cov_0.536946_1_plen_84_part_10